MLCTGVELGELPENISEQVITSGEDGYDFILVPTSSSSGQKSLVSQELLLGSAAWQVYVLARLSDPADLESPLEETSRDCQARLTRELSSLTYLGLQAVTLSLRPEGNTRLAVLVRDCLYQEVVRFQVWV